MIGFTWPATRESQIKKVDILAEKEEEVIIVEIEDIESRGLEYGVQFTELGGILLLAYLSVKSLNKKASLCLVVREDIDETRFYKIKEVVNQSRDSLRPLDIEIQTRPL